nr:TolC family protein [Desulfobulbaceae bacterium]
MLIRQTICTSLLLFFLSVGQSPAADLTTEPAYPALWTARDAVRFALSHNPDSAIGQQRLIAAQAAIDLERAAIHARLAFEVMRAFYGITQAKEIIDVNKSTVEALLSSLKMAQARHEEGVLLVDAVLDLEVQLSRARENSIQAQHALALARKIFLTLLGIEGGAFEVVPESGDIQEAPPSDASSPRFELKILDDKLELAIGLEVEQAKIALRET